MKKTDIALLLGTGLLNLAALPALAQAEDEMMPPPPSSVFSEEVKPPHDEVPAPREPAVEKDGLTPIPYTDGDVNIANVRVEKNNAPVEPLRPKGTHARETVRGMVPENTATSKLDKDEGSEAIAAPAKNDREDKHKFARGNHAAKSVRGYVPAKSAPKQNSSESVATPAPKSQVKMVRVAPGQYGESIANIVAEEVKALGK